MRLSTKLYLFFAGVVVLPLLVAALLFSFFLNRSSENTYRTRMQSGLAAVSAIVSQQDRFLAASLAESAKNANAAALVSADKARRDAILAVIGNDTGALSVTVTGPAGAIQGQAGAAGAAPMLKAVVNINAAGGTWILTALKPIDTNSIAAVFSPQELKWGVLAGGSVIAGSLPAGPFPAPEGMPAGKTAAAGTFTARAGGQDLVAMALSPPAQISDRQLTLVAAVPSATVSEASQRVLEAGLALTALALALAVLLGLFLTRNLTGPLRKLRSAAAAGAAGNLDQGVEIRSRDEVGDLASSFNMMQAGLRGFISELEDSRTRLQLALSYTGDILGSTFDRNRLVKTTAEAARLAAGALGVWVEVPPAYGSAPHGAIVVSVPAGFFKDGLAEAAGRLAPAVMSDPSAADRIQNIDAGAIAVAYPISHGENILGAMVAIFDRRRPPEKGMRSILGSLAAQAASALENISFGELQQRLAVTDHMTGLANFRSFQRSLEQEVSKSRRYRRQLSLAMIDLDDFKVVNDRFGHQAGDEALKSVAGVLTRRIRSSDTVARYGGEEFALVFPETTKAAAVKVAGSLRDAIAGIRLPSALGARITASIGVASFPDDAGDESTLISKADAALYRAKEGGKNRVVF